MSTSTSPNPAKVRMRRVRSPNTLSSTPAEEYAAIATELTAAAAWEPEGLAEVEAAVTAMLGERPSRPRPDGDPAKVRAGKLGGLSTSLRHGPAHYRALGKHKAGMNVLGATPAARRLWSARIASLRGKPAAERAKLVQQWKAEASR